MAETPYDARWLEYDDDTRSSKVAGWCPSCSRVVQTLDTNLGEPACPRCGGPLEEPGTGDDDPDN